MSCSNLKKSLVTVALATIGCLAFAGSDGAAQLPYVLQNAYVGVSTGYFNAKFKNQDLPAGYTASSISNPHGSARVVVGTRINKNFAFQLSLLRPFYWTKYRDINGAGGHNTVWLNIFGATLKPSINIGHSLSLYAEGGYGLISRHGFAIAGTNVMPDATLSGFMLGGGAEYRIKPHWGLNIGTIYLPAHKSKQQPAVSYTYFGVNYYLHKLSPETVTKSAANNALFPRNYAFASISNSSLGYGPLSAVSAKKVPIFFRGAVRMRTGYGLGYERNVFHSAKHFALNVGANVEKWQSKINKSDVYTIAVYPNFRFILVNKPQFAWYLNYEIAGPTYISKSFIDGNDIGKNFIFQDAIGTGFNFGPQQRFNLGVKIMHYSNGNLFPQNPGVETPVTVDFGINW